MNRRNLSIVFLLAFLVFNTKTFPSNAQPSWTIMIYAQADSILNNFAIKNFNEMASVGSNKNLNIIVQWNQPRQNGTWRYKIDKNKMTLISTGEQSEKQPAAQDLVDFASFAATNYPADNYAFIFWNHGVGILDPEWNGLQQFSVNNLQINPTVLKQNPRIQIDGITKFDRITKSFEIHRGILFDTINRTYLNNQGLSSALSFITKNILHKKFAIIGMDACLMAMFEVFYQIKDFADYSVSSEEVELAQGWNYTPFLHTLSQAPITTEQLAQNIVKTYEDFYKDKTTFFTQSAVNLTKLDFLKQNIDDFVQSVHACKQIDRMRIERAILRARNMCLQFSTACYVDLHSFYEELNKQLISLEFECTHFTPNTTYPQNLPRTMLATRTQTNINFIQSEDYKNLKQSISNGMQTINQIVVANVTSSYLSSAKGISIYFPQRSIDASYLKTRFANESLWVSFLQDSIK